MKGKPIMISDAATTAFWPWLRAKFGFNDAQIRKYTFNLAPFLVDPKAIQEGYVTSEPYTIETAGPFQAAGLLLADNGYPGYREHGAVAAEMDRHQTAARAGVRGCDGGGMAGLSLRQSGPANALIKRDNPEMTDGLISQARDKMRRYNIVEASKTASRIALELEPT